MCGGVLLSHETACALMHAAFGRALEHTTLREGRRTVEFHALDHSVCVTCPEEAHHRDTKRMGGWGQAGGF